MTFSKEKKIPVLSHFGERYWKRQNVPHGIIKYGFLFVLLSIIALFSNRNKKQERKVKIIGIFQNTTARPLIIIIQLIVFLRWKLKQTLTAGKWWFSAHPVIWHHLISKGSASATENVHTVCIQNWACPITEKGNIRGQIWKLNPAYGQS